MSTLAAIEGIVLGPLGGRPEGDWERGPAGKWSPAQIVEHLAISMIASAEKFEHRRAYAPMRRRSRGVVERAARVAVLGLRWYPQGFRAPEFTQPADRIRQADAEAHFREGLRRWDVLERELLPSRPKDLFVRHPLLGDLTAGEWLRFHLIHARHHVPQIRERLGT